jgi:hypothetical protein
MPLPDMTPAQLLHAAAIINGRVPNAVLVKNQVGNLVIVQEGAYIGWLDLRYGAVTWFEDEDQAPDAANS